MKKNILFVLPWLPYPLTSGGRQAVFNGIMAVKDDFNIYITYKAYKGRKGKCDEDSFLHFIPNAILLPFLLKDPVTFNVRIKNWVRKIWDLLFFSGEKIHLSYIDSMNKFWLSRYAPYDKEWSLFVNNLCQEYRFDIIQVEMTMMLSQILSLPIQGKKIFVHHELGFVRRDLESKVLDYNAYDEAFKVFADYNEISLLNRYNTVMTLSSVDANKLVDNGVTVPVRSSFSITSTNLQNDIVLSDGYKLVFVGTEAHMPNYLGVNWFLENCWSDLLRIDKGYGLTIVGKWSKATKIRILNKYPNVSFSGFVNNLEDIFKGSIMIVPITVGSGIRMKILEAAAIGTPVISTSVGAEGIPVKDGVHCMIADDSFEFVKAIEKLKDKKLQKMFIENARELVKSHYSIESLRRDRMQIYNEL